LLQNIGLELFLWPFEDLSPDSKKKKAQISRMCISINHATRDLVHLIIPIGL